MRRALPPAATLHFVALFAASVAATAPPARASEVLCVPDTCCAPKPAWSDTGFATFTGKIAIQTSEPVTQFDYVVTAYHLDTGIPPLNTNWDPPNGLMKRFNGPKDGSGFGIWRGNILGSVFGITLDDQGNVYVCQTSAYYNDYIASVPGATAGGVYKIDAVTGAVTTFATLPNFADPSENPGENMPCLGNITFDCRHRQFFVSDLEDGKIYRLGMSGTILSVYDPNLPDNGLPGWAPYGERIWAVQWHNDNRLYYSTWDNDWSGSGTGPNRIWSLALDGAGDFVPASEQVLFSLPPLPSYTYSNPVSDISFMPDGRMLCAERSMFTKTWPYAHTSRLLSYMCEGAAIGWIPSGQTWDISAYNNASSAGGVDSDHDTYSGGTHGRVWATGDALHFLSNDYIYGLQGLPPTGGNVAVSYLIDKDGNVTSGDKFNQGDVEVPCPVQPNHDNGSIGGMKFWDKNCNGELDQGEPGLPGWTIVLTGPVSLTVTTNAAGQYSFSGLPAGTYTVCELGSFGWTPTSPANGCYTITLTGQNVTNLNFGNCQKCTGSQGCSNTPANMVAWWPFDEPAGPISHDVLGLHNGTQYNAPTLCVGPTGSNSLSFNGSNQYVLVPNSYQLNFGSNADFTIDAWVKMLGNSSTNVILDKRAIIGGNPVGYTLAMQAGKLAFAMQDGSASGVTYVSTNVQPINTWVHVAVVVSRTSNQGWAYVNGVLDGTFVPSSTAPGSISNTAPLYIGRSYTSTNYWRGCIDDVEIFCRALPVGEIAEIVTKGKCKQYCSVPQVVTYPSSATTVTLNLTICNYDWSQPSTTYSWSCLGLPAGGSCLLNGPTVITPNAGVVTVPAGTCVNVPVTMQRPAGLGAGQTACYQFTVQNQTTNQCFGCQGTLKGAKKIWIDVDTGVIGVPDGSARTATLTLHNDDAFLPANPTLYVGEAGGGGTPGAPSTGVISLNGLPPGEPWINSIAIPPGGTIGLPIDILYGTCKGKFIDYLNVKLDEDGTGAFDDLCDLRVSQTIGDVTAVPTAPQSTEPVQLAAMPNPFRSATTIQLTLQRETSVDVRVFDLAGRLVRRLYSGTRQAGASPVVWDGRDDQGASVRPGLYFVRVEAGGDRMSARLIRVE